MQAAHRSFKSIFVFLLFACWIFGCSSDSESKSDVGSSDKGIPDKGSDEGIPDKGSDETVPDDSSPDVNVSCEEGTSLFTSTLVLDTAHFEFTACTGQGAGHTTAFSLMAVRFQDSSDKLPEKDRSKTIVLTPKQMVEAAGIGPHPLPEGKQLIYSANHHNACDSFHVTFSEIGASYAATSSALAGCGIVVGDAPERTMDDTGKLWYRVKYPGQDWGEKKEHATRQHFLLDHF